MTLALQNFFLIFLSNFPTVSLGMNFWVEDTRVQFRLEKVLLFEVQKL